MLIRVFNFNFLFFLFFICLSSQAQILINEFSAANKSNYLDNYNENEDWIELYNAGASAVNLTGYYLSDKNNNPTKWQIPSGSIPAGGTILYFASGRDEVSGVNYHTNFKITQTKQEWVVLSDATGTIIDSYHILDPMQENHSIGRETDGASSWVYFTTPTVNVSNGGSHFDNYALKPVFTLSPGFYTGSQNIGFTVPAGINIYYTLNGDVPDNSSTSYTTPFTVSNTTIVRAVAYSSNVNIGPSFNENNTYFIDDSHTLPVISVAGDFTTLFASGTQIKNSYEFFGADQLLKFELEGDTKRHGNDSWAYAQKGMRFYARDDYGYAHRMEYAFFPNTPRDKFRVLIMKAGGSDNYPSGGGWNANPAHMRDGIVQSMAIKADMHVDCRSYENAIVYINGNYWGVYELRERIDDDYCNKYYNQDADEDEVNMLEYWGGLVIEYGDATSWNTAYNFISTNNLTIPANYNTACDMVDKESFIDYFIINTFFVNSDWLNWNTKWWEGTGGAGVKWKYTLWDMDNTFDLGQNYTGLPTTGVYANPCDVQTLFPNNPNIPHVVMFNKLFDNDDFFQDYLNRYADLLNTNLHKDSIVDFIDDLYTKLLPEMTEHTTKWGGTVPGWTANVNALKTFANTRWDTVMGSLVDCYSPQITGIHELILEVDPPLAGKIKINTVTPTTYPWSGTYFGGLNLDFTAIPESGYIFDHWETTSMSINPGLTVDEISSMLNSDDTLRAVFVGDRVLTIMVEPVNSGTVTVDGVLINSYPWTSNNALGTSINLTASSNAHHTFLTWETAAGNIINPSLLDSVSILDFNDSDTVIAHFDTISYALTINCIPADAASIWVDGNQELTNGFPFKIHRKWGGSIDFYVEYDSYNYEFLYWESQASILLPSVNTEEISFEVIGGDSIIAVFDKRVHTVFITIPEDAGEIVINGIKQAVFPHEESFIQGTNQIINAEPYIEYRFDKWYTPSNFLDNPSNESFNHLTPNISDTVFAFFERLDINPQFPNVIYPGGPNTLTSQFIIPLDQSLIIGFEIVIYDRWGKQIFYSSDPNITWDGRFRGEYVATDSYIYEISFISTISHREQKHQGSITVIR